MAFVFCEVIQGRGPLGLSGVPSLEFVSKSTLFRDPMLPVTIDNIQTTPCTFFRKCGSITESRASLNFVAHKKLETQCFFLLLHHKNKLRVNIWFSSYKIRKHVN